MAGYSAIVVARRLPIQTRCGWALDGVRWAVRWGWMGPQSPSKPVADGMDGLFSFFGWAFPGNGVVPVPPVESANSRGPPERQRVILGRLGRFIFRNLVLKPCDHTIGSRTWVFAREQPCPFWTILQPLV